MRVNGHDSCLRVRMLAEVWGLYVLCASAILPLVGCVDIMGPATSRSNELLIYNDTSDDIIVLYNWKSDILQNTRLLESGRGDDFKKLPIGETTNADFRFNIYASKQSPTVRTDTFKNRAGQELKITADAASHTTAWSISSRGTQVTIENRSNIPRLAVVLVAPADTLGENGPPGTDSAVTNLAAGQIPSLRNVGGGALLEREPYPELFLVRVEPNSTASELLTLKGRSDTFAFGIVVMDLVKAVDFQQTLVPEEKKTIKAIIRSGYELEVRDELRGM